MPRATQEPPPLVVSEEEHRRRLGEALAAASSDAALRREDVEKRLQCATHVTRSVYHSFPLWTHRVLKLFQRIRRSKDEELTQLKVLAAEKDLALKSLQARSQELLERCEYITKCHLPMCLFLDLHPSTTQLRKSMKCLYRVAGGGTGQIRGRDAEIVAALSVHGSGGPDRSVHVDPFVERTHTSREIAQNEVCTSAYG